MDRNKLCEYLDTYLELPFYKDMSLNGLQVEGVSEVTRVGVATDARLRTFEIAAKENIDFLIVHHGLFWGRSLPLVGTHLKRVKTLFEHEINLYAAHLPLDGHMEVGNNAVMAKKLGLEGISPWSEYKGQTIGAAGELAKPTPIENFQQQFEELIKEADGEVRLYGKGPSVVKRVAIVSGDASQDIMAASKQGFDVFITGEVNHIFAAPADEMGVWMLSGGHYATETFGVRALGAHLEDKFGLDVTFLRAPTYS